MSNPKLYSRTIYFGYGSNMCIEQMLNRCPESIYIGVAVLPHYRWFINVRDDPTNKGVANIKASNTDYVYGLVFGLTASDEVKLDKTKGVHTNVYNKYDLPVQLVAPHEVRGRTINAIVYIDINHTRKGIPRDGYKERLREATGSAVQKGVPQHYIDRYILPSIT